MLLSFKDGNIEKGMFSVFEKVKEIFEIILDYIYIFRGFFRLYVSGFGVMIGLSFVFLVCFGFFGEE